MRGWLWDYAEPRSCLGAGRRRWVLRGPRAALPRTLSFCLVCFVSCVVFSLRMGRTKPAGSSPELFGVSTNLLSHPLREEPWGFGGCTGPPGTVPPCPPVLWGRVTRTGRARLSCGTEINVKSWQSNEPKIQQKNKLLIARVVSGLLRDICGFYVMCQSLPGARRGGGHLPQCAGGRRASSSSWRCPFREEREAQGSPL